MFDDAFPVVEFILVLVHQHRLLHWTCTDFDSLLWNLLVFDSLVGFLQFYRLFTTFEVAVLLF